MKLILATAISTCTGRPPTPKEPPRPVEASDPSVTTARDDERRRRRASTSNTFLTSYSGDLGQAPITVKTLMGQ